MRYFIILLSFVFATGTLQAQNVISINASAEVLVPADEISFHITLNAEAETPQEAYELHKEREKVLVDLLKEYRIPERRIKFDPISITRRNTNRSSNPNDEKVQILTRQNVSLALDDFDIYEKIQIALIDNDFNQFSGNFTSSESEKAKDEALREALKTAREKADIIAREMGLSISGTEEINYSHNVDPPQPMMEMRATDGSDNLMEFDQSVGVSASVSVSYKFEE